MENEKTINRFQLSSNQSEADKLFSNDGLNKSQQELETGAFLLFNMKERCDTCTLKLTNKENVQTRRAYHTRWWTSKRISLCNKCGLKYSHDRYCIRCLRAYDTGANTKKSKKGLIVCSHCKSIVPYFK